MLSCFINFFQLIGTDESIEGHQPALPTDCLSSPIKNGYNLNRSVSQPNGDAEMNQRRPSWSAMYNRNGTVQNGCPNNGLSPDQNNGVKVNMSPYCSPTDEKKFHELMGAETVSDRI